MGLCFSVNKGIRVPPSLVNIFKELNSDLGCTVPSHGDLTKWSHQGVLLLNTVMTVRQGQANSHKSRGWEKFTDACISQLSQKRRGIVFLLWGKPAQAKEKLIPAARHHILKCPHPSPLASASGPGFSGCRHFSQANNLLMKSGLPPVDWSLE
ncbi:uracil-DNA glycosylase [Dunaliella salina]|nr:uracil-DNA glycosylase [Dunaliella salina]|eukprot:KAF5828781.1 uracil-DNA glycosylase [Dunaliella salina]